jgi:hypothetical protein
MIFFYFVTPLGPDFLQKRNKGAAQLLLGLSSPLVLLARSYLN